MQLIESLRSQHTAVSAVLQTLRRLLEVGPAAQRDRYFAVLRSMLLYLDEFHETFLHPIESQILYPAVTSACPGQMPVAQVLRSESALHEAKIREVQHLLNGWEMIGDVRRARLVIAAQAYIAFYLRYLRMQEMHIIGPAQLRMPEDARQAMDRQFARQWPALAAQENSPGPATHEPLPADVAPLFNLTTDPAPH